MENISLSLIIIITFDNIFNFEFSTLSTTPRNNKALCLYDKIPTDKGCIPYSPGRFSLNLT